tara:strand:- start:28152 stop:28400 length:249 start_codon:yes stop_codon:yes gene_type:complete
MPISIQPRMINKTEALNYIGITQSVFSSRREFFEQSGFPKPHPIIKKYDIKQLDAWLERTNEEIGVKSARDQLLEKIKSGNV